MAADSTDGMRLSLDAISCIVLEYELIKMCCYFFLKNVVLGTGLIQYSILSGLFLTFTTQEKREI
jgi:hypothetical protein